MKWVYSKYDISLPRVSKDQAGKYVSKSNLETGDLVFFTTKHSKGKIGHVGMYIGDGMMIHTYGEGGVKYSTINSDWWEDHYVTARRVINWKRRIVFVPGHGDDFFVLRGTVFCYD